MEQKNNYLYHLIAFLVIGVWGMTFISTRVLIDHGMTPEEIFLVRFVMAYIGMWAVAPRKLWCDNWKDELWTVAGGITGGSIYFYGENTAVGLTYVNNVSFIVCSAPLFTAFFDLIMRRKKPSRALIIGSVLALFGMLLVIFNGDFSFHFVPRGDLLALLAAVLWGLYGITINKVSDRYDTKFITRKVFFYGVITILPFFISKPWVFPMEGFADPIVMFNVLFLGVLASLICYEAWNVALKRLGTITASNYVYLNPVFTVLGSFLFLNESITGIAMIGSALILLGVYWASKK
ncbi:MAG: DMT family transporter [Bacteroides sp.]|nr:DMT family transporter [Bacteroides sp.]